MEVEVDVVVVVPLAVVDVVVDDAFGMDVDVEDVVVGQMVVVDAGATVVVVVDRGAVDVVAPATDPPPAVVGCAELVVVNATLEVVVSATKVGEVEVDVSGMPGTPGRSAKVVEGALTVFNTREWPSDPTHNTTPTTAMATPKTATATAGLRRTACTSERTGLIALWMIRIMDDKESAAT